MNRVIHGGTSLAIVVVAYWTYALLAVPLIEPQARPRGGDSERLVEGRRTESGALPKELQALFLPDSWEMKDPNVLGSSEVKILFQKYESQSNGWMRLYPLTMIMLPAEPADDLAERARQAMILEVPEGARLQFDPPLDLVGRKMGRLIAGTLSGRVTIRSQGKSPGPEDDLLLVTRDVGLEGQVVSTPHPVEFRWGPHYGSGRHMEMTLLRRDPATAGNKFGPDIGGVKDFTVQSVERLHLDLGQLSAQRAAAEKKSTTPAAQAPVSKLAGGLGGAGKPGEPPLPIEVTCRGKFFFDMVGNVATFEKNVNLLRVAPSGPSDQLSCELLSIFFAPPPKAPANKPVNPMSLQPVRIEARGAPAKVSAPSSQVVARADRIQYNLQTGAIVLDQGRDVMLQQGPNSIHARDLCYVPGATGQLGRVDAQGPGMLRGTSASGGQQGSADAIEARWSDRLQMRPEEGRHRISLVGEAQLQSGATGQLRAREIAFYVRETPQTGPLGQPGQSRLQPEQMVAAGDVRIESAQLTGACQRMEIGFIALPPSNAPAAPPVGRRLVPIGTPVARPLAPVVDPAAAAASSPAAAERAAPQQHFEIIGQTIQGRVLLRDNRQTELIDLAVIDQVRLVETRTAQPNQAPLVVTGQQLRLVDGNRPEAQVTVIGQPASLEARGLTLVGPSINLQRAANRVTVAGAGQMRVPVDRDMEGRPLRAPSSMEVTWQRQMVFDGRTARFEEGVTAANAEQRLQTRFLDVQFRTAVDFSQSTAPKEPPQIEQVFCRGGVLLENRSIDGQQVVSFDRIQVDDMAMNLISGAIQAGGPGLLLSVRRDSGRNPLEMPMPGMGQPSTVSTAPRRPPARPAAAVGPDGPLLGLRLRFLGSITGNMHRRELSFHDRVRATHAPAQSWLATLDSENPQALGAGAVVLDCDHLTLNDMSPGSGAGAAMELLAVGNVVAEGNTLSNKGQMLNYTARAMRLSFCQAKDLLVLEGDGRSEAQLFLEQHVGTAPSKFAAQKILYKPKENRTIVDGVRSLELNQFPDGQWRGRK